MENSKQTDSKPRLPPRLAEVAILAAQGWSDKAIGQKLGLGTRTVTIYVQRAASRLDGPGPPRLRLRRYFQLF